MNKIDFHVMEHFGLIYRSFIAYTNEYLAGTDISFSESVLLANIAKNKEANQETISKKLNIDRAAIARNTKTLEAKGYVVTEKSSEDRRAKVLSLTPKGKQLCELIAEKNSERLIYLFSDIADEDIDSFGKVLRDIVEKL
jgi:DNA-binding MarR family transcriptional regulator